jgi:hypothetical protein
MRDAPTWVPVAILFGILLLAYVGMWRGWRRRGRKHDLPPLVACPEEPRDEASRRELPEARLQSSGRYFGTTTSGDWLDRVVARGLGARSSCRLSLSAEGLDVIRPAGSFRIPAAALRGARLDQGIAGKVVPPHGLLVVTWQHGDYLLDTGFRLDLSGVDGAQATSAPDKSVGERHDAWVRSISKMVKENV